MAPRTARTKDGREVVVRPAAEDDAADLLDALRSVAAEEVYILTETVSLDLEGERAWIRGFDGERGRLLVAEVDGKVVGMADARLGRERKTRHVGRIGIALREGYRGVGIGTLLMEDLLAWLRDRGAEKATLEVFATNARAIRLYRKLGFEIEAVRKGHFKIRGAYVDDVIMSRWLVPPPDAG